MTKLTQQLTVSWLAKQAGSTQPMAASGTAHWAAAPNKLPHCWLETASKLHSITPTTFVSAVDRVVRFFSDTSLMLRSDF